MLKLLFILASTSLIGYFNGEAYAYNLTAPNVASLLVPQSAALLAPRVSIPSPQPWAGKMVPPVPALDNVLAAYAARFANPSPQLHVQPQGSGLNSAQVGYNAPPAAVDASSSGYGNLHGMRGPAFYPPWRQISDTPRATQWIPKPTLIGNVSSTGLPLIHPGNLLVGNVEHNPAVAAAARELLTKYYGVRGLKGVRGSSSWRPRRHKSNSKSSNAVHGVNSRRKLVPKHLHSSSHQEAKASDSAAIGSHLKASANNNLAGSRALYSTEEEMKRTKLPGRSGHHRFPGNRALLADTKPRLVGNRALLGGEKRKTAANRALYDLSKFHVANRALHRVTRHQQTS
ncbi:hypothetical protein GE061_003832 [Apolygus lucorum]|uniref:Uncharacterized protein n=1 Tax=Apolygus lucorum TaxID=248454 RepID=A0A6A4JM17_APOLU|nr:hypothetical protein GE061_003832 [Apolygus lucorum]